MQNDMLEITNQFAMTADMLVCVRYGEGHINETYLVVDKNGREYILQRINHQVFCDVAGLMKNIELVCDYIKSIESDERKYMTLIPTKDGKSYYQKDSEHYFRMYEFIGDSVCLQKAQNEEEFRQSAIAFGNFQKQLAGFDATKLSETIVDFHHTPKRYQNLHRAIENDVCGRAKLVQKEIDFALSQEAFSHTLIDLVEKGLMPLRVTHNDTKLNNVMLDRKTGKALAVIDLDTVMPGLSVNDFGDSIRFGASTATEDERDLDKVSVSLDLFRAYTNGFLSACGSSLTQMEKDQLTAGAKMMTLECGIRFLTDYLEGDTYFQIHREGHNLDRARTQFKLVSDMNAKWDALNQIVIEESVCK